MHRRMALAVAVMFLAAISSLIAQVPAPGGPQRAWTLEEAVVASLAQHPLVEAARARVSARQSESDGVRAFVNPVGTFWMERGQPSESSFYLTYPIESILQRGPRVRRADEDTRAAAASLTLARRQVAAETVRAFFGVALSQSLYEEAEENRNRLEQLVSYNRARVGEGVTAEGELLRLEVELARAANDVVLSEVEYTRSRARLAPYLGAQHTNGGVLTIRASVPAPSGFPIAPIPTLDAVLASARAGRPEITASRARVAAAAADLRLEQSLAVRSFGGTLGSKRTEGRSGLVAALNVTIPLFNLNGASIARAASERSASEQELLWAERSVSTEVEGMHSAAIRLTQQLAELQKTFLSRAEQMHELTLAAYQEGGATLLQVLDATRMLADARLTYARTLFAQRESLFDLALATGSAPTDALGLLRAWSAPPIRTGVAGDEP